ncbi:MAG: PLDc N-terminal domain-containing protein [Cyclobacteriaceae bacterium]|nr:PLDc N-terminal domain-containing protein [Cyclobacteriaceae bacterium]
MARLLFILVLILDVIVILDILRSNKDMEKKVLWVVAVFFLPLLGPLLYYIIARESSK